METGFPKTLMYLIQNPKKEISYQEIYEKHLNKFTKEYKEKFYPKGCKNPSQFEQDMIDLALRMAKSEFESNQNCISILEMIKVNDSESYRIYKNIIENRNDFLRWIENTPVPSKPKPPDWNVECTCGSTMTASEYCEHVKHCIWHYVFDTSLTQAIKDFIHWIARLIQKENVE